MAAATTRSASRSTSSSPRSTTTRRRKSGAWTSRSAPPPNPTPRRARCWQHSTSRSGSEGESSFKRGKPGDLDGEEEFDREEQSASPTDQEIFRAPRAAQSDRTRQGQADGGAVRRNVEARRAPAQLRGEPRPQSLRDDGTAARLLPQAQAVPHCAPRPRVQGNDPRPAQVELVRRTVRWL